MMMESDETMNISGKVRRFFRYYKFEDFPSETQEAILQVRAYEETCSGADKDRLIVSKGIKGRRYELYESPRYIRDREYLEDNGYDLTVLDNVIAMLLDGYRLPRRYKIHKLKGDGNGLWDCHIKDDWILLYTYRPDGLVLEAIRTGSHRKLLHI